MREEIRRLQAYLRYETVASCLVKAAWIRGRKNRGTQKAMVQHGEETDAGGGTKIKYCKTAETGHRSDPGTLGKGTKRRRAGRSLC